MRDLGPHPENQQSIAIYSGRYGPYVKYGKTNATLPPGVDPMTVSLEEALQLLAVKTAKGKPAQEKPTKQKPRKSKPITPAAKLIAATRKLRKAA